MLKCRLCGGLARRESAGKGKSLITDCSFKEVTTNMNEALAEAKKAAAENGVPVGCVITDGSGNIISRARNLPGKSLLVHGHAEILAINEAAEKRGSLNLSDCTLYVTLEPCPMCLGAIESAGIKSVFYGARRPSGSNGACRVPCLGGILENECAALLGDFFAEIRNSAERYNYL
jgi:tRNA(adenine34) deaminase